MIRALRLLAVIVTLFAGTAASAQIALAEARQARVAGDVDRAERLLKEVLQNHPGDFIALYNMGLVYDIRAAKVPPGAQRTRLLEIAAGWFDRAIVRLRAGASRDYSIYNSAGVISLKLREYGRAEALFREGLKYEAQLPPGSRAKLYSNMGYLYAVRGDTAQALPWLRKAAGAGSANARTNLARLSN